MGLDNFSCYVSLSTSLKQLDIGFSSLHCLAICNGRSLASSVQASVVQGKWSSKEWKWNKKPSGGKLVKEWLCHKQNGVYVKTLLRGELQWSLIWPEWVAKIGFPQGRGSPSFSFFHVPNLYHCPLQMSVTLTVLGCPMLRIRSL